MFALYGRTSLVELDWILSCYQNIYFKQDFFRLRFMFLILKKFFFLNLRFHLPNCTLSKLFKAKKEELNLRVKRAMRVYK